MPGGRRVGAGRGVYRRRQGDFVLGQGAGHCWNLMRGSRMARRMSESSMPTSVNTLMIEDEDQQDTCLRLTRALNRQRAGHGQVEDDGDGDARDQRGQHPADGRNERVERQPAPDSA